MNKLLKKAMSAILTISVGAALVGCETKAQTGALVGGGGGAAVGAGIGSLSHSRAGEGALIGGAVGALGGYIVGNEMDKQDQRDRDAAYQRVNRGNREAVYINPGAPAPVNRPVTKEDVINWTRAGDKDEIIIDRIQRGGAIFRMTAADENQIRDAGVSEEVVRAMKNTAR